jgi:hypothetical protein
MANNTPSFRYPFTMPKDVHPQVANALRSSYNSLSDLNQAIEALNTKVNALPTTSTAAATALALAVNGIPTGDQERLNLQSAGSTVTLTDLGAGNVNLEAAVTAAATYTGDFLWSMDTMMSKLGGPFGTGSNWGWSVATNNSICAIRLQVYVTITVASLSMGMGNLPGGTVNCGIYSADGSTKIFDAGLGFNAGVSGKQTVTLGTPVALTPGSYWAATSASNGTASAAAGVTLPNSGGATGQWNNFSVVRVSDATGVLSGGLMPASLGTLNASSRTSVPGFWMNS